MCAFSYARMNFYFCDLDLDLDPMTLIYKFDLNILRNGVSRSKLLKVRAQIAQTGHNWVHYHAALVGCKIIIVCECSLILSTNIGMLRSKNVTQVFASVGYF